MGHLCPGLYAAAKIAMLRIFAKNLKNRKVGNFLKASGENFRKSPSLTNFRVSLRFYKCIINIIDERPKNIIDTIALCKSQNIRM